MVWIKSRNACDQNGAKIQAEKCVVGEKGGGGVVLIGCRETRDVNTMAGAHVGHQQALNVAGLSLDYILIYNNTMLSLGQDRCVVDVLGAFA